MCYTKLLDDRLAQIAADCGRLSICYTTLSGLMEPEELRIAAVSRFATLTPTEQPTRRPLRIAAVSRFATLWFTPSRNRCVLRIAAVSRFATLRADDTVVWPPLRIAAVSRFATLLHPVRPRPRLLRIAAVSRFATLRTRSIGPGASLRIAAVSRFATLPCRQPVEMKRGFPSPQLRKTRAGRGEAALAGVFSRHRRLSG